MQLVDVFNGDGERACVPDAHWFTDGATATFLSSACRLLLNNTPAIIEIISLFIGLIQTDTKSRLGADQVPPLRLRHPSSCYSPPNVQMRKKPEKKVELHKINSMLSIFALYGYVQRPSCSICSSTLPCIQTLLQKPFKSIGGNGKRIYN